MVSIESLVINVPSKVKRKPLSGPLSSISPALSMVLYVSQGECAIPGWAKDESTATALRPFHLAPAIIYSQQLRAASDHSPHTQTRNAGINEMDYSSKTGPCPAHPNHHINLWRRSLPS